jgi:hypothetical protein
MRPSAFESPIGFSVHAKYNSSVLNRPHQQRATFNSDSSER